MKAVSRIVLAAAALIVAVAGMGLWSVFDYQQRKTAEMVAVADRLVVPRTWERLGNTVRGEDILCLNASTACPSLSRSWQTDVEFTPGLLDRLATEAGWDMIIEGSCTRRDNVIGASGVCSAAGKANEYSISLRVESPGEGEPQILFLALEEDT
jgi:hypothetical protein